MADSRAQRIKALNRIENAARTGAAILDLNGMRLTKLPSEIGKLTNLTGLYLDGNRLRSLPREIGKLTNLTALYLSENQLRSLPPDIGKLTNLANLYLSKNQLGSLPLDIGKLTNLIWLDLSGNKLTALPPEIVNLTNLTGLVLSGNKLTALQPGIGNLTNLTLLDLRRNQLTALPSEIGNLSKLTVLYLSDNQLAALPPEIWKLTNLTLLDLSGNKLTSLPPEIGNMTNLTALGLTINHITVLPQEIWKLTKLTNLLLFGNKLSSLPPEIGELKSLVRIVLQNNQLASLPHEIGRLTNLTALNLDGNQLTALPPEIGKLTKLTRLGLRSNRLTALPLEIGKLTNLTKLDLGDNRLTALPSEIGNLTNLNGLLIGGNPFPAEIVWLDKKGKLIAYLQELAAQEEQAHPFDEAKLLLIGPGEVGKTWLLRALQGKVPQPTKPTPGIEIARQPLDIPHPTEEERAIHFNCWDFGGQDNYQVTHQIFFSPKAIYLLVWKPRPGVDPNIFARLERIELSAGRTAKVFIVSTHADDPVPAVIGEQAIKERFGDLIGGFFKVDSLKGPEGTGIAALREAIAKAASTLEGMNDPVPAAWHDASAAIRELEDSTIPFDRFAEVCNEHGVSTDSAERLAIVLDVQGHVVYFSEAASSEKACVDGAENLVVLDPEWLAKAVAMVIVDEPTIENFGVLEHKRLPEIWKEHLKCGAGTEKSLCGYLLWLMWKREFDIAYRLNEQTSLVPEMIQRNRPDDLRWTPTVQSPEPQAALIGRIPHNPPLGLVPVFTTAVHPLRRIDKDDPWDRNWRNGFFLDSARRGAAFVELQDRDLRMTVRDDYPAHLLGQLHNTLEDAIKTRWPNLDIDYRIPCSGYLDGRPCPGSFKLSYLKSRRGRKVDCQHCGSDAIQVDPLLDGYDVREEQMMAILKDVRAGQQDHMALALKMYHDFLDPVRAELERAPCMISILPDEGGKWNLLSKATQQSYRVTCWCEHPDGPHPGATLFSNTPPDYRLKMPRNWVVKAAPYLSWLTMLAKTFVPLAGKVVETGMGDMLDKNLKQHIELMGDLAKALPSGRLELDRQDELEAGSIQGQRPEIVALRHIHDTLLAHVPENQRWGDLRPVRTRAHGLLWLCAKHAAIQNPPIQQIG